MKILVFSDSHGSDRTITRALELHGRTSELALHAGDGAHSFMLLSAEHPAVNFRAVRGNCDSPRSFFGSEELFEEELIAVGAHKLLLTHGHRLAVKLSLSMLIAHARSRGADIVVFGHTHTPLERYIPDDEDGDAVYLFNPGAAKDGRYGIIEIRDNGVWLQNASLA